MLSQRVPVPRKGSRDRDPPENTNHCPDYVSWVRACTQFHTTFVKTPLMTYFPRPGSTPKGHGGRDREDTHLVSRELARIMKPARRAERRKSSRRRERRLMTTQPGTHIIPRGVEDLAHLVREVMHSAEEPSRNLNPDHVAGCSMCWLIVLGSAGSHWMKPALPSLNAVFFGFCTGRDLL